MFQLQLFFLLLCDEWDRVVALPRHKFVTGATLLQLNWSSKPTFLAHLAKGNVIFCHHLFKIARNEEINLSYVQ
jgi:hypothetical protein